MTTQLKLGLMVVLLFILALASLVVVAGTRVYREFAPMLAASGSRMAYSTHNSRGNDAYGRHDYITAIQEYSAMVDERPDKMEGYFFRAMAEDHVHQYTAEIRDDGIVLALLKTPHPFYYSPQQQRRYRFDSNPEASALTDNLAATLYNRGLAYENKGWPAQAIADFSASLKYVPNDDDCLGARMTAYYENKQYAQAIAASTLLIRQNPQDDYVHGIRGKSEKALEKYDAAFKDLTAALTINPHYIPAYLVLGEMADSTHQYPQIIAIEEKGMLANPDNASLMGTKGWLQYQADQVPAAIVTDKQALAQDASQNWVRYNLGLCYAALGDAEDAKQTYAQALAQSSPVSRAEAKNDLENALRRHPGSAALHQSLQQFTD